MSNKRAVRIVWTVVGVVGFMVIGIVVAVMATDDSAPDSAVDRAFDRVFNSGVDGARTPQDVAFLDDYSEELGIVMSRQRGSYTGKYDAEAFARRVDGPGPDIEILELDGSLGDEDGATVVLRLRRERTETEWMGPGETYEISACYRWVFGGPDGDSGPERLDECPDTSVIELGPPPVEPALPAGLAEELERGLRPLVERDTIAEDAIMKKVRSIYVDVVREVLDRPDTDPEAVLSEDEAVAGEDRIATADDGAVGVAVGKRGECLLVRLVPGDHVRSWSPPSISQAPGEIGCSASWAARGGEL